MTDDYRDDALMMALRMLDPATALPSPSADDPDAIRLLHRIVALDRQPRRPGVSILSLHRRRLVQNGVHTRRLAPKLIAAATLVAAIGGILAVRHESVQSPNAPKGNTGFVVTAASVQEMAAATRDAVAHSGAAEASFTNTIAGLDGAAPQTWSGSSMIAFSGSDIRATSQFSIAPGDRDGQPVAESATFRVVAGREYGLYKGAWYVLPHRPSSGVGMLQPDTDPRTFLQVLSPDAMFQFVDREKIDGVELSHLRAGNKDLTFSITQDVTVDQAQANGKDVIRHVFLTWTVDVNALDVWVDGDGIVHRLNVTMSTSTNAVSPSPSAVVTIGGFPPERMTDVVSITFSQFGETESVTAPAHASASAPPGCGGSDACIIPGYGVLPAIPLNIR